MALHILPRTLCGKWRTPRIAPASLRGVAPNLALSSKSHDIPCPGERNLVELSLDGGLVRGRGSRLEVNLVDLSLDRGAGLEGLVRGGPGWREPC